MKVEKNIEVRLTSAERHDINASNGDEPQNVRVEKCNTVDVADLSQDGPPVPSCRLDLLQEIGAQLDALSLLVDGLGRSPCATQRPINALLSRLWAQLGVVKAIVGVFVEDELTNGPS